jgi:hypothetical protein
MNELFYAIQNKHSKPLNRRIALEQEKEDAVKLYVTKLRKDIGAYVIPSRSETLLQAQQLASDMETYFGEKRAYRKMYLPDSSQKPLRPILKKPTPVLKTNEERRFDRTESRSLAERIKCSKCGRQGHIADKCYARNLQSASQRNLPPPKVNQIMETVNEEAEKFATLHSRKRTPIHTHIKTKKRSKNVHRHWSRNKFGQRKSSQRY